ncbi:S24 family peptidase [Paraburkholderia sp. MPAMCS5]|uniref:LexA family protein n=1 Tax=Paraburkholderia sp. MPAMCS5 TaxID=3112563 RepID=UPI002E17973B|nr:S24 family peptidase [Paraburkholderia sp. MPAMCS5]
MFKSTQPARFLRVTSDSMYNAAHPRDSFMVGDTVAVNSDRVPEDGDFVIVASDGFQSLMKLTIRRGVRYFEYTSPDRSGFELTDNDVSVIGVVSARHRPFCVDLVGPLKWLGDDIGMNNDHPIFINLSDQSGRSRMVSLREALLAADRIDEYGLNRITTALSFFAEHGYLRPMDLDAWNEFKSDQAFCKSEEVCHA